MTPRSLIAATQPFDWVLLYIQAIRSHDEALTGLSQMTTFSLAVLAVPITAVRL